MNLFHFTFQTHNVYSKFEYRSHAKLLHLVIYPFRQNSKIQNFGNKNYLSSATPNPKRIVTSCYGCNFINLIFIRQKH